MSVYPFTDRWPFEVVVDFWILIIKLLGTFIFKFWGTCFPLLSSIFPHNGYAVLHVHWGCMRRPVASRSCRQLTVVIRRVCGVILLWIWLYIFLAAIFSCVHWVFFHVFIGHSVVKYGYKSFALFVVGFIIEIEDFFLSYYGYKFFVVHM